LGKDDRPVVYLDWRDHWIYFLITDLFNNPVAPPRDKWDVPAGELSFDLLFSNKRATEGIYPIQAVEKLPGTVQVYQLSGDTTNGLVRVIRVELMPGDIQLWGKGL
jgi:hypothetical protein